MMFPSCGCNQFRAHVGTGPTFSRSMLRASTSSLIHFSSLVIAVPTSVEPILLSILSCGHCTTETNGNMYSVFAIELSQSLTCRTVGRR